MSDKQSLPPPMVPADVDLRDFEFMPLKVARLRDSRVASLENAEAFRAAVMSWCAAWHQIPTASLPDDDAELCALLGYGRDIRTWKKLRAAGALHGWERCSDGRLYHRRVATAALESWIEKLFHRKKSGAGNAKRWGTEYDEETINASLKDAARMLAALDPQSKTLTRTKLLAVLQGIQQGQQGQSPSDPTRSPTAIQQGVPQRSHKESSSDPNRQGQGEGEGEGEGEGFKLSSEDKSSSDSPPAAKHGKNKASDYPPDFEAFWTAYPRKVDKGHGFKAWQKRVKQGVDPQEMLAGAKRYAEICAAKDTDPEFIAHAQTWLNGERWKDQILPTGGGGRAVDPEAYRHHSEAHKAWLAGGKAGPRPELSDFLNQSDRQNQHEALA